MECRLHSLLRYDLPSPGWIPYIGNTLSRPYQYAFGGQIILTTTECIKARTAWSEFGTYQIGMGLIKTAAIIALLVPSILLTICFKGLSTMLTKKNDWVTISDGKRWMTLSLNERQDYQEMQRESLHTLPWPPKAWEEIDSVCGKAFFGKIDLLRYVRQYRTISLNRIEDNELPTQLHSVIGSIHKDTTLPLVIKLPADTTLSEKRTSQLVTHLSEYGSHLILLSEGKLDVTTPITGAKSCSLTEALDANTQLCVVGGVGTLLSCTVARNETS